MTDLIRILPKQAPNYMASKWIHFDLLVEKEGMKSLFASLGEPLYLFSTLGVAPVNSHEIQIPDFLDEWQRYIDTLKAGLLPTDADYRYFFTAAITKTKSALRALDLANEKEIIIPYEPVLQMQIHRFSYSLADEKFHSMAFGDRSISWGVRISYPQLYQYPATRTVENALDESAFINAGLFTALRSWIRANTQATPFIVQGKKINDPMRISKDCFSWINNHAGLQNSSLTI
jgi:hypothetical protein